MKQNANKITSYVLDNSSKQLRNNTPISERLYNVRFLLCMQSSYMRRITKSGHFVTADKTCQL